MGLNVSEAYRRFIARYECFRWISLAALSVLLKKLFSPMEESQTHDDKKFLRNCCVTEVTNHIFGSLFIYS